MNFPPPRPVSPLRRLGSALALLAAFAFSGCGDPIPASTSAAPAPAPGVESGASAATVAALALPKLVNLGADKCIPCKQMVPVRQAIASEYAGQVEVTFIDVWADREAGKAHRVRVIPTQIILAPDGTELFRHEGYWPKEAILAQFKSLGFALTPLPPPVPDRS